MALAISDTTRWNALVKQALDKSRNYPRWINAINKAVVQIELNGDWITWMPETKSIVIWNQETNKIHAANGVCDCDAFQRGFPCYHRAIARLVRLYMQTESKSVKPATEVTYLPDNNGKRDASLQVGRIRI